jgi:hypothetical protein
MTNIQPNSKFENTKRRFDLEERKQRNKILVESNSSYFSRNERENKGAMERGARAEFDFRRHNQ